MWPAKRKQPRPRPPACAGKAARLPFPQQKPPFGAVFLWVADGSRLMPPAAKVPVCLRLFGRGRRAYEQRRPIGIAGSTRSSLSPGQAARNTDRPCRCPHRPRTGASRPTSSQPAALLRRSRKNNGGPVARMPPLSCHQRAEGLRLSILEHFPVCNASRSKPSSLSIHGKRGFSAWFRPGGAVTPPRVFPFFKGKTL